MSRPLAENFILKKPATSVAGVHENANVLFIVPNATLCIFFEVHPVRLHLLPQIGG